MLENYEKLFMKQKLFTKNFIFLVAGAAFLMPISIFLKYIILILSFCIEQVICMIFSIFALSMIQERTPVHLTGKVMAYVLTISLCAQPLGQLLYGFLFDVFAHNVFLVLLPSSIIICAIGWLSSGFFAKLNHNVPSA